MTVAEFRDEVIKNYREGEKINLKIKGETRAADKVISGVIDRFYPNHVSVKHNGYIESFLYWEFYNIASEAKTSKPVIPGRLKKSKICIILKI